MTERERPYIDRHICYSDLRYTYPRVCKAINDIKDFADSSLHIRARDIYSSGPDKNDVEIQLTLPVVKKLTKEFEILFDHNYTSDEDIEQIGTRKNIMLFWERDSKNSRFWTLDIGGKIKCERYNEVIEGMENYNECPCPKEYTGTCKGIISILKKHAL